jgi:hypothetical protein
MKVDFKPLPGEVERYDLIVTEDDDDDITDGQSIGTVKRHNATEWGFFPRGESLTPAGEEIPDEGLPLQGESIEELREHFALRMQTVKLPPNRLSSEVMGGHCMTVLDGLRELADESHALAPFLRSVAVILARTVELNMKPEKVDDFMREFVAEVGVIRKAERTRIDAEDGLRDFLKDRLGDTLAKLADKVKAKSDASKH